MTALEYFGGDELPASVWEDKYRLTDLDETPRETDPDQMHRRLAREFARVERGKFKIPYSEDFIYGLLKGFGPIIPQGGGMAGIGSSAFVSLSNCFVVEPPADSYGGVMLTDEQLVQISKRRGGVGTDLSHIRPDDMPTTNSVRRATGVVPFMRRFSNTIREVAQKGRRGALMLTLSVHHPQVLDFARAKTDATEVTGANISIRVTDEFMRAVELGADYEQRWPIEGPPKMTKVVDARTVWREINKCAHHRAEPGILFWDTVLRYSPADCYAASGFRTVSTNPCGELGMCPLDSCRLLLLNLFCFVDRPFAPDAAFNFTRLYETARIAQRLMDDLVDLEIECVDRILGKIAADPEPAATKARELDIWTTVRHKAVAGRRTGTGPTALGDAMAAVGVRYGSEESTTFAERVYRTMKLGCYRASVDMAEELGPFPLWDAYLEKGHPFLTRIRDEDPVLYADMQKYGRRNIALLTTAPAGSTSIVAGPDPQYAGVTSGIEPLFKDEPYTRRKKITHAAPGVVADFVDATGDGWTHHPVFHGKLKMWMAVTGDTDWKNSPYHGACAEDLDWVSRVKLQAAAQRHVDHAISSTINLPEDAAVEQVEEIYTTAWRSGCKGMTVYRKNCRSGVLIDAAPPPAPAAGKITKTTAPKRPKELPCDLHPMTIAGTFGTVLVGLMGGDPYEVFVVNGWISKEDGILRRAGRGKYEFVPPAGGVFSLSTEVLPDDVAALTRVTSTSLRHGADIKFVVHQLEKVRGPLNGASKAIARALKKYITDGTAVSGEACEKCGREDTLVRQEGCVACRGCGHSKC